MDFNPSAQMEHYSQSSPNRKGGEVCSTCVNEHLRRTTLFLFISLPVHPYLYHSSTRPELSAPHIFLKNNKKTTLLPPSGIETPFTSVESSLSHSPPFPSLLTFLPSWFSFACNLG